MQPFGGSDLPDVARQRAEWFTTRRPPDNEVPVGVGLNLVLLEDDKTCVALTGALVYGSGVELSLIGVFSDGARRTPLLFPHGPADRDVLLFGVEFSDGRTASVFDFREIGQRPVPAPDVPSLILSRGNGAGRMSTSSLFLAPLPPPGPVRLVAAWPSRGLEERIHEIDTRPLLSAARSARVLWPRQDHAPETRVVQPNVPSGGWFDQRRQPQ